jgi:hypothetical protein
MLYKRNGGTPKRRCFPTRFSTSWATDHFEISGVKGIAGDWGIDSTSDAGSAYLINEWGYPDIGVVICDMPSGGHDVVMLDYSGMRHECEPSVAYVDGDRIPRRIADSFAEFIEQLIECDDLPK